MNTSKSPSTSAAPTTLTGVGPARAEALAEKDIHSVRDLLFYFPRRHEDLREVYSADNLLPATDSLVDKPVRAIAVRSRIERATETFLKHRRQRLFQIRAGDLTCVWFHAFPGLKQQLKSGTEWIFVGKPKVVAPGKIELTHPEFHSAELPPGKDQRNWGCLTPVYPAGEGLSQKFLRDAVAQALALAHEIPESLPKSVITEHKLMAIAAALQACHFPSTPDETTLAMQRFVFEEFFYFLLLFEKTKTAKTGAAPSFSKLEATSAHLKNLPFSLTESQRKAMSEIASDLALTAPMHRILQGDVGSGKSVVAFYSLLLAAENGVQAALLAPTELLAQQLYQTFHKLFPSMAPKTALLVGSMSADDKRTALERVANGEAIMVFGTHLLLEEKVRWKKLGLMVVDEQHRFGVIQRGAFQGESPHLLTMTATPIPRTLALTLFDIPLSSLEHSPAGRKPVITKALHKQHRQRMYDLINREVIAGRQAFLVYPRIEQVEKEVKRLSEGPLAALRIGFVHGRLPADEAACRLEEFRAGKLDVLVSTTVIEVGIDIPNASVMVVEHADRFGLAQLHQLRGRVGRGAAQSYCVLVTEKVKPEPGDDDDANRTVWDRLLTIEKNSDGFAISEADLANRGPGDFFGVDQSGKPPFRVASLSEHLPELKAARTAVREILAKDPDLQQVENTALRAWIESRIAAAKRHLRSG